MSDFVELPDADSREPWVEVVASSANPTTCPKCGGYCATRSVAVYGAGLDVVVAERRIRCGGCRFFSGEPITLEAAGIR